MLYPVFRMASAQHWPRFEVSFRRAPGAANYLGLSAAIAAVASFSSTPSISGWAPPLKSWNSLMAWWCGTTAAQSRAPYEPSPVFAAPLLPSSQRPPASLRSSSACAASASSANTWCNDRPKAHAGGGQPPEHRVRFAALRCATMAASSRGTRDRGQHRPPRRQVRGASRMIARTDEEREWVLIEARCQLSGNCSPSAQPVRNLSAHLGTVCTRGQYRFRRSAL